MPAPKRILVAPLNWGLGHATRCIPVINKLLEKGCEVIIASSERPYHLLKQEFPQLTHIYFPNYEVDYPENENMAVTILRKSPAMFVETYKENQKLKQLIWEHNIKGVIADNRFGFYNSKVPTVFLAHQLNLQMTPGFAWLKPFANAANLSYARRFDKIWIPDYRGEVNLTGSLSHFDELPRNARYVGPLSRFEGKAVAQTGEFEGLELLITLSGPEPQRSILEEELTKQALALPYKTLMVVGKTEDGAERVAVSPTLTKVAHLNADKMLEAMAAAKYVVCRSGYSTIMDLVATGGQAAFIPTPGQPEQEYLAQLYKQQGRANYMEQHNVSLPGLIEDYANYKGFEGYPKENSLLDGAVEEFLTLA